MFKLLKRNTGNAGTSKENNCPSDFFTNQLLRNFSCSEKFNKIPKKTSMVVYFELVLAIKTSPRTAAFEIIWESRRNGFLCYRYSRSKLLE